MQKLQVLVLLLSVGYIFACNNQPQNPTTVVTLSSSGDLSDMGNFQGGTPGATTDVHIPASMTGIISVPSVFGALTVAGEGAVANVNSLLVTYQFNIQNGGQGTLGSYSAVTVSESTNMGIKTDKKRGSVAGGTLNIAPGAVFGTPVLNVNEDSLISGDVKLYGTFINLNESTLTCDGTVNVDSDTTLLCTGDESVLIIDGGLLNSTENLNLGGAISLKNGASIDAPSTTVNSLSFDTASNFVLASPVMVTDSTTLASGANVALAAGSSNLAALNIEGSAVLVAQSTFTAASLSQSGSSSLVLTNNAKAILNVANLAGNVVIVLPDGSNFVDEYVVAEYTSRSNEWNSVTVKSGSQTDSSYSVRYESTRAVAYKTSTSGASTLVAGMVAFVAGIFLF